jgi:hypothetical protein
MHLIPIWAFEYFPSQDGPVHLENASIIRDYYHPERSIYPNYYEFNKNFTPTWLGHLILTGLMYIVPALIAEKIFLTFYVILLPVSVRYALSTIRPEAGFLVYLSFPFIYNYTLHLGFYSFVFSLSFFFFMIGYWLKYRSHFTLPRILILACLSMLLYFFHVVSLVMAYLAIAIFTTWLILMDFMDAKAAESNKIIIFREIAQRRIFPIFVAFLPTLILLLIFMQPRGLEVRLDRSFSEILYILRDLLQIEALVSYQTAEFWISVALGLTFWGLFLYLIMLKTKRRGFDRLDGFLFVIATYVLIFMLSPKSISKFEIISPRLNLYPFFALMIWFAAQSYQEIVKRIIMVVSISISLIALSFHIVKYAELNDYMSEYLSATERIESNTTLLPISFSSRGFSSDGKVLTLKAKPFLHASGYIAAQKGVVDFTNYEAGEFDWFPLIFRPALNPYMHIGIDQGIEAEPPRVDFLGYSERTSGQVDYVLIWGFKEQQSNLENTKSIFRQLYDGYQLIYSSPKRGMMKLYRKKELNESK